MQTDKLKISVVTVCYNAVKDIEKTILSVVDQTYDNIEYIIIDGGSTDGTVDIIKKYVDGGAEYGKHKHTIAYWVSEPDKGIYDAMNKGIRIASGDYINFMNAGDCFYNNDVIQLLVRNADGLGDVFYGNYFCVNLKKSEIPVYKKPLIISKIISKYPLCHQATFTRLSYHKEHLFDTSFKIVADWNFFRKAYLNDKIIFKHVDFPICIFDETYGMSHDNLDLLYKERYRCMGIHKKFFKKLPHEIIRHGVHIKRWLKRKNII